MFGPVYKDFFSGLTEGANNERMGAKMTKTEWVMLVVFLFLATGGVFVSLDERSANEEAASLVKTYLAGKCAISQDGEGQVVENHDALIPTFRHGYTKATVLANGTTVVTGPILLFKDGKVSMHDGKDLTFTDCVK